MACHVLLLQLPVGGCERGVVVVLLLLLLQLRDVSRLMQHCWRASGSCVASVSCICKLHLQVASASCMCRLHVHVAPVRCIACV